MLRAHFCLFCGEPMEAGGRIDRKYCRPSCRTLAYRDRNGHRRKARPASTAAIATPPSALVELAMRLEAQEAESRREMSALRQRNAELEAEIARLRTATSLPRVSKAEPEPRREASAHNAVPHGADRPATLSPPQGSTRPSVRPTALSSRLTRPQRNPRESASREADSVSAARSLQASPPSASIAPQIPPRIAAPHQKAHSTDYSVHSTCGGFGAQGTASRSTCRRAARSGAYPCAAHGDPSRHAAKLQPSAGRNNGS